MKVLSINQTNQTITIEPRYFTENTLYIEITKESSRDTTSQIALYSIDNGVMTVNFDLVANEGEKFVFKIIDNNNVIYRCKAFATDQDPQSYKLTNNKYKYPNV